MGNFNENRPSTSSSRCSELNNYFNGSMACQPSNFPTGYPLRQMNMNRGPMRPPFVNREFPRCEMWRPGSRPKHYGPGPANFRPPYFTQPFPFPPLFRIPNRRNFQRGPPPPERFGFHMSERSQFPRNDSPFFRQPPRFHFQHERPFLRQPMWEFPYEQDVMVNCPPNFEIERVPRFPSSPDGIGTNDTLVETSLFSRFNGNGGSEDDLQLDDLDEEYDPEPVCKKPRSLLQEYIPQFLPDERDRNNDSSSPSSSNGEIKRSFVISPTSEDVELVEQESKSTEELEKAIWIFLQNHITEVKVISPASSAPPSPPVKLELRDDLYYNGDYLQVSIYGYCKTLILGNGKLLPVASYGICFKQGNDANFGGRLKESIIQTKLAAELMAAERAILIAKLQFKQNMLNINTESKYIHHNVQVWANRTQCDNAGEFAPEDWTEHKHFDEIKRLCNAFADMKIQWTLIDPRSTARSEINIARDLSLKAESFTDDFLVSTDPDETKKPIEDIMSESEHEIFSHK